MSSEKPTLPSIQLMLEGASIQSVPPTTGKSSSHRRNASDVVVGSFENLSLTTPTPMEPNASNTTTTSVPNWPSPFRPTPLYQYPYHHHRSARNLHSRSYSDYTHPYATTPQPPAQQRSDLLAPFQQHHRRAVSTSTLDMMLNHHQRLPLDSPPALLPSQSTSTSPHSPTLSIKTPSSVDEPHFDTHNDDTLQQKVRMTGSSSTSTTSGKDNNNKYQCFYCQKGFSRPSSLKIHIYSHTKEKPFTCPEPNCGRSFSVQSNMRRHIRVHKLNGRHLKIRRSPPPLKPLCAKPSWMQGPLTQDTASVLH